MKKLFFAAGCISLVWFALPVSAQMRISEIMYDAPGTDAGYEWIEVQNTSSQAIDIAEWRFRENEVDHYLSLESGSSSVVSPGGYAVIVSDSAKFLASVVGFSGIVFDSVFSLGNQGESLELISGDTVIDSVYYTPQDGANGTGGTLQYLNASWVAGVATPGKSNTNTSPPPSNNEDNSSGGSTDTSSDSNGGFTSTTQTSAKSKTKSAPFEPYYSGTLKIPVGMLAGSPFIFDFEMLYYREENKKPITKHGGEFIWNMGDGNHFIQDWEKEFSYVYEYPGTYTVYISYTSSDMKTEPDYIFQKNITISKADIHIGTIDDQGSVRIDNNTGQTINLSQWLIAYDGLSYLFPEHTLIPSGEQRFVAKNIHHFESLNPRSNLPIALLRPTGEIHQQDSVAHLVAEDARLHTELLQASEGFQKGQEDDIEMDEISITDIKDTKSLKPLDYADPIVWSIGGISLVSLIGGLFLALRARKKEAIILSH